MLIIEQHRHAWRRARDLQGVSVRILNKEMEFKMAHKKESKRKKAFSTICFEKQKQQSRVEPQVAILDFLWTMGVTIMIKKKMLQWR